MILIIIIIYDLIILHLIFNVNKNIKDFINFINFINNVKEKKYDRLTIILLNYFISSTLEPYISITGIENMNPTPGSSK